MGKTEIEIGRGLDEVGAEVITAWKAAEAGHPVETTDLIHFVDWSALCSVLTPKRFEMLRHLRRASATGVRALARSLDRDVKRVHDDVVSLAELGLITRAEDGSLSTAVDEITSTIHIAA